MANQFPTRSKSEKTLVQKTIEFLASVGAFALTVLGVGPAFQASVIWVQDYIATQYDPSFSGIAAVGWFIVIACLMFGSLRLLFAILMNLATLKSTWWVR